MKQFVVNTMKATQLLKGVTQVPVHYRITKSSD